MQLEIPEDLTDAITGEFASLLTRIAEDTARVLRQRVSEVPEPGGSILRSLITRYSSTSLLFPAKFIIGLAFDLGVTQFERLVRVSEAITLACLHSDILDDIIDTKGISPEFPLKNIYLSHILFNYFVLGWIDICLPEKEFRGYEDFLKFEIETYNALYDEETNHVGISHPYSQLEFVAQKCAPFKAVAFQVMRLSDKEELSNLVLSIIDRGSLAMIILDDIRDWEDDYDNCRFTYPIQRALDALKIEYDAKHHEFIKEQIFRALWYDVLLHELLKEATDLLQWCGDNSRPFSAKIAFWFYEFRSAIIDRWHKHVQILANAVTS